MLFSCTIRGQNDAFLSELVNIATRTSDKAATDTTREKEEKKTQLDNDTVLH